jgi:precorrin isomerase
MIHASADFELVQNIRFSTDGVSHAIRALRAGAPIYVDANMARVGLSMARLSRVNPGYSASHIHCHVSDADVAEAAQKKNLPRSILAVRKAKPILDGAIAAFGNAPLALMELNRMIVEEGQRPAFVVAMPVGFVHVVESKEELIALNVPHVTIRGRRGGSALAVSAIHALCSIAEKEENI